MKLISAVPVPRCCQTNVLKEGRLKRKEDGLLNKNRKTFFRLSTSSFFKTGNKAMDVQTIWYKYNLKLYKKKKIYRKLDVTKMCRQVQCAYLNRGKDTLKYITLYLHHLDHFPQDQLINFLRRRNSFFTVRGSLQRIWDIPYYGRYRVNVSIFVWLFSLSYLLITSTIQSVCEYQKNIKLSPVLSWRKVGLRSKEIFEVLSVLPPVLFSLIFLIE